MHRPKNELSIYIEHLANPAGRQIRQQGHPCSCATIIVTYSSA